MRIRQTHLIRLSFAFTCCALIHTDTGFASTAAPADKAGPETRYAQTCAVCHEEGVRGAPVPGVPDDWNYRLELGVQELYLNTLDGMGEMPPRGACPDCTDAEIEAIVDFMLKQSPPESE